MSAEILLIEDDEGDALIIKRALSKADIDASWHHANTGEKALALIQELAESQSYPDLILLDLNLPRVDGKEVLRHIRAQEAYAHIPLIALSGSLNPKDREEALAFGASEYFHKSIDLAEFMQLGPTAQALLNGQAGH